MGFRSGRKSCRGTMCLRVGSDETVDRFNGGETGTEEEGQERFLGVCLEQLNRGGKRRWEKGIRGLDTPSLRHCSYLVPSLPLPSGGAPGATAQPPASTRHPRTPECLIDEAASPPQRLLFGFSEHA